MPDDSTRRLPGIETISEWSPELIGFEPTTSPFDVADPAEERGFMEALHDARRAGTEFHVVEDRRGRLAIWLRFTQFFIDEAPALPAAARAT